MRRILCVQNYSLEPLCDNDFADGDHKSKITIFPSHKCWNILYEKVILMGLMM